MFRTLFTIIFVIISCAVFGQKLPSRISPQLASKPPGYFNDSISLFNYLVESEKQPSIPGARHLGWNVYLIHTSPRNIWQFMSSFEPYRYIDELIKPVTETGVISYDMSANRISTAWHFFPQNGLGYTISIKENRMDTNDVDLLKRYVPSGNSSPIGETHATVMATLIAGAGNSLFTGKGVAPKARYSSSDFFTVMPDEPSYYRSLGIRVQNHSYGTGIQNFYGINARAFDTSVDSIQSLLHVFSSGNSGNQASSGGIYAGITGFANITGNMKMAKNILLVGSMDASGNVPPLSSKGPLYDGRIAPHIVSFGEDGSSGAAALSSGVALLAQQVYAEQNNNQIPSSALIKAAIVNSADRDAEKAPDYLSGYGRMNANNALLTLKDKRYFSGELEPFDQMEFPLNLPPGTAELKLTVCWNDPAAPSGSAKALLNDLDMELILPSGETVLPWVLSHYPHADSLVKGAERRKDSLNNLEQISLKDPTPGVYKIRIKSAKLTGATQAFAIAFQMRPGSTFNWDFPFMKDALVSGSETYLRWNSTMDETGDLEQSINNGPWELIAGDVDLKTEEYLLTLADSAYELKLRMRTSVGDFETENLLVAPIMQNRFGYVCDTAILNYWFKLPQASSYKLYRLLNDSMVHIAATPDTAVSVAKDGSSYFAVAPVIRGIEAFRGQGIDYNNQNVGCFINNFLADLHTNNSILLSLSLGSLYRVKNIEFRKLSTGNNIIYSVEPQASLHYEFIDTKPHQGLNIYQAIVYLDNGAPVFSEKVTVYYLNNRKHILYPNPAPRGADIYLVSELVENETAMIYDNNGRLLSIFLIDEKNKKLPTGSLPAGYYHLRIIGVTRDQHRYSFIIR